MSQLPKAKIARATVEEKASGDFRRIKDDATKLILNAINDGRSMINLDIPVFHFKAVRSWLKDLGYAVNCGDCSRNGTWFHVRW